MDAAAVPRLDGTGDASAKPEVDADSPATETSGDALRAGSLQKPHMCPRHEQPQLSKQEKKFGAHRMHAGIIVMFTEIAARMLTMTPTPIDCIS